MPLRNREAFWGKLKDGQIEKLPPDEWKFRRLFNAGALKLERFIAAKVTRRAV